MKIAVLAHDGLELEMREKILGSNVEAIFVSSLEALIQEKNVDVYFDLDFQLETERINRLREILPKLIFVNSVGHTIDEINLPIARINAWPGFLQREYCEIAAIDAEIKNLASTCLSDMGWQFEFVPDIPGMISAGIIAMIVNEAYYTLQDEVSTKDEIDIAMKLGTNYPFGPFEWSRKIGLNNIYELLKKLGKTSNRYKVSELLENEIKNQ